MASSSIAIIAEVNEDSAPPCSALVSMPMSCNEREVSTTKGDESAHALFEETLYDSGVHHFILIHLADSGPNDILRETLYWMVRKHMRS